MSYTVDKHVMGKWMRWTRQRLTSAAAATRWVKGAWPGEYRVRPAKWPAGGLKNWPTITVA